MTEPDAAGAAVDRLASAVEREIRRHARPQPGLYVVATPIGNLADVTLRALRILCSADLVLCEDSRITRRLLDRYGLTSRLMTYHDHNAAERRPQILDRLSRGGVVALVSDAGTPLVSDPGYKLVRAAQDAGHPVHAVPGASALLAALVSAGLPTDRFWFEGFLPAKQGARAARIAQLAELDATLVLFESPHRLAAALSALADGLGAREAAVARELTKRFEEVRHGPLPELAATCAAGPPLKGEIVVVIAPGTPASAPEQDEEAIASRLVMLVESVGTREAAAQLAKETGLKRRDLYQRALRLTGNDG